MHYKTEGIVLRETEYRDSDKILTVLTKDYGKITLKARGVRKNSSKLKSACQLLSYAEFTYQDYGGYLTVTEASVLEMFSELRTDIEKISLSFYFAQVVELLSEEDDPNPEILSLLLNSLYALSKLNKPQALVKAAFELRIACLAGYQPDLSACALCGEASPDRFNVTRGMLQCAACFAEQPDGLRMPISPASLAAARYLIFCDRKRLFSFTLPEAAMKELAGIAETYLITQLERSFSTLDMYKSLFYTNITIGDHHERNH